MSNLWAKSKKTRIAIKVSSRKTHLGSRRTRSPRQTVRRHTDRRRVVVSRMATGVATVVIVVAVSVKVASGAVARLMQHCLSVLLSISMFTSVEFFFFSKKVDTA